MPSIQVDLPLTADEATKRAFAKRIGRIYGEIMQVGMDLLTVSVHALGNGAVWRCHESGPPTPSGLIMCDIRAGRPTETDRRVRRDVRARRVVAEGRVHPARRQRDVPPAPRRVQPELVRRRALSGYSLRRSWRASMT